MFTTDAHCDTLFSLAVNHQTENLMITPELLRAGNVGLQTFAMFAGSEGPADHPYEKAVAMLAEAKKYPVPMIVGKLISVDLVGGVAIVQEG